MNAPAEDMFKFQVDIQFHFYKINPGGFLCPTAI